MEVAQISRDIARTLGLNEDLTECVALAHDLGHPPFGHAGEEVMDTWMQQHGSSFEHNEQSFRIVTLLEEHSSLYQGLNLNREILDGLRKHASPYDRFPAHSAPAPTLESQIVDLADEIAYSGHDCEDGLQAKLFSPTELRCVKIIAEALALAEHRGTSLRGALIHLLVLDLYQASEEKISSQRITTPDSIAHAGIPLICFSPPTREALNELRDFLWEHLYLHPRVCSANEEGKTIVSSLCASYLSAPPPKVLSLQEKTKGALYEAVKDYVAGMTDAYALEQARTRGIIRESAHPPPLGMEDS
jgi:dGTPase